MHAPSAPRDGASSVERQTLVENYADLSRSYVERAEGRLAALAMWGSDVALLERLLWENGLGESPDPQAQVAAIGEALLGCLTPATAQAKAGTTARQSVERSREAMAATFDESVHAMLASRFVPPDHLDGLPQPAAKDTGESAARRLVGRTPHELAADLQTTAADCMAVAEVMLLEQDVTAALRQARQADLASFEGYLVVAAIRAGDSTLASVDLRWDLAAMVGVGTYAQEQPGDLEQAVGASRDRLVRLVGSAEADGLRACFEPVPSP